MSNKKLKGLYAFPSHLPEVGIGCLGMELRDYFAAKALQGELASQHPDFGEDNYADNSGDTIGLAEWAYRMADAMMLARNKKE